LKQEDLCLDFFTSFDLAIPSLNTVINYTNNGRHGRT